MSNTKGEAMKFTMKAMLMAGLMAAASITMANDSINTQALHHNVTVKQALSLKDDSKVQLKGYVVKAIGDEKYQFRDNTGTITVDIDDDLWNGKAVSAKTPVTLIGEVDIDHKPAKRIEIDVDQVRF